MVIYPNLESEIARRGIKKRAIASTLGISDRSLYSKMTGIAPFTWDEVCEVQKVFFPDKDKDMLLERADETKQTDAS